MNEISFFFLSKRKRNRIDIPLDVYVSFIISRFFDISLYLLSLKKMREKEQMDPIPYIEHSFLSIDRKIFVKYRTLPFFLEFLISKAAYHKHPTPYD